MEWNIFWSCCSEEEAGGSPFLFTYTVMQDLKILPFFSPSVLNSHNPMHTYVAFCWRCPAIVFWVILLFKMFYMKCISFSFLLFICLLIGSHDMGLAHGILLLENNNKKKNLVNYFIFIPHHRLYRGTQIALLEN